MAPSFAWRVFACFLPFAAGYLLSYVYRTVNAVVGPRIADELAIDLAALDGERIEFDVIDEGKIGRAHV